MKQLDNVQILKPLEVRALSEVDVGDLNVAFNLQHVDFIEGVDAVEEVEQVLPVHKHFKSLVPAANRHLRSKDKRNQRDSFT